MNYALFIDKLSNGGAERVTTLLANHLFQKGNTIFIFVANATISTSNYYLADGIQVVELPYNSNRLLRTYSRFRLLKSVFKQVRFDACICMTYTFTPFIILLSKRIRGRIISSLRNAPKHEANSIKISIIRYILFRFSDSIVFQTPDAQDYFSEPIRKKGIIIPNPVSNNLPFFDPLNHKKNVIMACRIEEQKNIGLALNAFRSFVTKHPDWSLEIYGEGSQKEHFESFVSNDEVLHNKVFFKGFANNIHEIMCQSGAYLSSSNFEGISNSMIEAMAIGLPVVCTDCPAGGARMFIKNGINGFLVPVNDSTAITEALDSLANNRDLMRSFSKESVKIRNELSSSTICSIWEKLLV